VLGAFFAGGGSLSLLIVVAVVAPVAEEVLKAAGALFLAEQRPWLVPAAWTLVAVTAVAGLVFAAIENAVYLWVYIDDPTPEVIRWRWVFGPLVHGTGSLLAGIGVARMWADVDRRAVPPRFTLAAPWLVAAMIVHGFYNGAVTIWELAGGGI
jgi:RsiW-degrading membrane proteinase PrsW (M82 family)